MTYTTQLIEAGTRPCTWLSARAAPDRIENMMYGDVNAFELLFPVLVLIVLGLVIFVAVRAGVGRAGSGGAASAVGRRGRSRAVEILDERYARGELTLEEYRERLQALGEDG